MTLLAGLTSFMIGNAYHAQMPGFAGDLGHGDPGVPTACCWPPTPPARCSRALRWKRGDGSSRLRAPPSCSPFCGACPCSRSRPSPIYALAIALLFAAGFFELSFNTMAQALVQINAPADIRGRVVGLFNMAGLGMRAFSGITVGLAGAAIGIHWSLGLSAAVLLAFCRSCIAAPAAAASPSQV